MKRFAELFETLDNTNSTLDKVEALRRYFATVPAGDASWAVYLLAGEKLPSVVKRQDLEQWCIDLTDLPAWLIRESRASVGDLAETITLLLEHAPLEPPQRCASDISLAEWVRRIKELKGLSELWQRLLVFEYWGSLGFRERFVFNKLLTGAFRVGVSKSLVIRALADSTGLDKAVIAHRLSGKWAPSEEHWHRLVAETTEVDVATPYPFFLATPLTERPQALGEAARWRFEWKWDGIRGQALKRQGQVVLWSRGDELLTDRFPEITAELATLPDDTVLDGELLAYRDGRPLAFSMLQTRIQRTAPDRAHIDAAPVVFMAYDLLEHEGEDIRPRPFSERRAMLESLLPTRARRLCASPLLDVESWEQAVTLQREARQRGVEGLMVKDSSSPYLVGRKRGFWWKWKVEPLSIDAVLLYAQAGSGKRSNLFTDYTFGLWDGDELTPVAKAYSGLTDREIAELDRWIRRNTEQRFGPVRNVTPHHVFELHFDSARRSTRHRSGVALRFPRIRRWRQDKRVEEANRLCELEALIDAS